MSELKDQFLLRRDVIFLNHGSFGACPRPIFDEYQNWQLELERQPVEFLGRRYEELLAEARTSLSQVVGTSPDEVVFIPNTTTGLNTVARSLELGPGDEILSTTQEYGAMDRMWQFVCENSGARYIRCSLPVPVKSSDDIVTAVHSLITDRTRVLFFSHITSSTALIMPVRKILSLISGKPVISVIDGAHAPGMIPLDLDTLGVDFYVGNCHKWMMAPKGSAFLYCARKNRAIVKPLVVSWGGTNHKKQVRPFLDEFEYTGTRDIAAWLSVPRAISFMKENNWELVRARSFSLLREFRKEIGSSLPGLNPLCPDTREWIGQMAAYEIPPCDGWVLQESLLKNHHIEVPITSVQGQSFIRISVQAYNSRDDLKALKDALIKEISLQKRSNRAVDVR